MAALFAGALVAGNLEADAAGTAAGGAVIVATAAESPRPALGVGGAATGGSNGDCAAATRGGETDALDPLELLATGGATGIAPLPVGLAPPPASKPGARDIGGAVAGFADGVIIALGGKALGGIPIAGIAPGGMAVGGKVLEG